jgi:hypothetical protein
LDLEFGVKPDGGTLSQHEAIRNIDHLAGWSRLCRSRRPDNVSERSVGLRVDNGDEDFHRVQRGVGEHPCSTAQIDWRVRMPFGPGDYTSSVNRGGVRQVLQEGLIGLGSGGERKLVLATDPALVANKEVRVRLACTGPL